MQGSVQPTGTSLFHFLRYRISTTTNIAILSTKRYYNINNNRNFKIDNENYRKIDRTKKTKHSKMFNDDCLFVHEWFFTVRSTFCLVSFRIAETVCASRRLIKATAGKRSVSGLATAIVHLPRGSSRKVSISRRSDAGLVATYTICVITTRPMVYYLRTLCALKAYVLLGQVQQSHSIERTLHTREKEIY